MEQAPDYSDSISPDRALSRFVPATRGAGHAGTGAPDMTDRPDHILGSGLPRFLLPQVLAPHPRSARAAFAPTAGAGRVAVSKETHREGRSEDDAVRT